MSAPTTGLGTDLAAVGIAGRPIVHWGLPAASLYEHAIRRGEARLAATGPLVVETGEHTGRSPRDKFVVEEPATADIWWGEVNHPLAPDRFRELHDDLASHLGDRELFVQDLYAGADPDYRLRVRVVSETAWAALFARNLFIVPTPAELASDHAREPDFTVLHAPSFEAEPAQHGTRSETAIAVSFSQGLILIAGTGYAGEIKKSIFGVLQYLLPKRDIATMHCSANVGRGGDTALFFGLSGTGKTTLSTDSTRTLIGDDEHGWSDRGIFNFEGGSYAKAIHLSPEAEPDIYRAVLRFGTVLENVVLDPDTREPRLDDDSLTENTRAAFPLSAITHATTTGRAGHPRHVVLLTADAFGVLPPVARLSPEQTLYWFLSGYTAKLAGTERGVKEPEATFSACFGAPFLPLHPTRYAELLRDRLRRHQPACWLVNTGWSGGPHGVGQRISIAHTRAIVRAIVGGTLTDVPTSADPIFAVNVPASCPGVPPEVLRPRETWSDPGAYDAAARRLARAFADNFKRFGAAVPPQVAAAGPRTESATASGGDQDG
jgi:phosphoenolpyruvate carboxykinase (ATP)